MSKRCHIYEKNKCGILSFSYSGVKIRFRSNEKKSLYLCHMVHPAVRWSVCPVLPSVLELKKKAQNRPRPKPYYHNRPALLPLPTHQRLLIGHASGLVCHQVGLSVNKTFEIVRLPPTSYDSSLSQ